MKLGLAALVLAGLVSAMRPAAACYNETQIILTPVQEVALAQRDVEDGRLGSAVQRVRARYPDIRTLPATSPPLVQRALRTYALALVRANGELDAALGWARSGNLEWALTTLSDLEKLRPNDPRMQADLAEAQVRLTRTRSEGLRVLEDLDRRDLLGSANAYVALARARRSGGDEGGAAAALRRCAAMSTDKSRCRAESTVEAS